MYTRKLSDWDAKYVAAQTLPSIIDRGIVDVDLARRYTELLTKHYKFYSVCAGARHHHWWLGGLHDHIMEMLGFMADQLKSFPDAYPGVTIEDAIIVAVLHDFDKIWAYEPITAEEKIKRDEPGATQFKALQEFKSTSGHFRILDGFSKTLLEIARFGIIPTDNQWSAVLFSHGGYSDANVSYGGLSRTGGTVMHYNPLAVLLHSADMFSAQLLGKSIA